MREFEIVIVGAGLAGSMAATMLARRGHSVAIVDPNETYPSDFRCEKLDGAKIDTLRRAGLAEPVLAAGTYDRHAWVTRLGHLVEKKRGDQYGIDYSHLVNTLRTEIPKEVTFIRGKVAAVTNTSDRQTIRLTFGETLTARLVVLANGLNNGLRQSLGMEREDLSLCHSVSFGFDLEPADGGRFPFRALTHYGEHPSTRVAYITLFPIGERMRANLFVHRPLDDPWLRAFRDNPDETLAAAMPRLQRFTGPFRVIGPVKMRPVDLYTTQGYLQPGVVLLGDAFATACPGAGTGASKAMVDAERLVNGGYVSRWLATPGMDVEKIAEFYADPGKTRSDRSSLALAWNARSMAIDESPRWWALRCGAALLGLARWAMHSAGELCHRLVRRGSADAASAAEDAPPATRPTGLERLVAARHRFMKETAQNPRLAYYGYEALLKGEAGAGKPAPGSTASQASGAAGQIWNTPAETLPMASTTAMLSKPESRPCIASSSASSPRAPIGIGGS
jgi:2-polyprenyl-6-methoxyphenol hydroxylase-like FAD-dependent oxidoreductase